MFYTQPNELPKRIDIEPTIRCNYACIYCQRTYWSRKAPDLTIKNFIKIYKMFGRLEKIKLQGFGEPLLNKNLFSMIKYAKKGGTLVEIFTNGSILDRDNRAAKLVTSGVNIVRISMDAGTKNLFESLRPKSKFEEVLGNSELLIKKNQMYGTTNLVVEWWVVATYNNISALPKIIQNASNIGIETVYVQMELNAYQYKSEIGDKLIPLHVSTMDNLSEIIEEAEISAKKYNIKLELEYTKGYSIKRKCHWPFDSCFISVEGFVVPCCTIGDPEIINFGNVFEEDFSEIWNSDRYKSFRNSILNNQLKECCRVCYFPSKGCIPKK